MPWVVVGHGWARLLRVLYRYCVQPRRSRRFSCAGGTPIKRPAEEPRGASSAAPRRKHLAAFSSCVAVTSCLTRNGGLGVARKLIEAAQRGDVAAQEELVRRFEPLVQRVVWKLWIPRGCDREDIAQEARVGLLAAIRAWQPERGPFPAFADRCVSNQALLALQAASARKHQVLSLAVSLDRRRDGSANSADDGLAPTLLDTLAAPRDPRADPEARLLLREQLSSMLQVLPTLTPSERAGLAMALNGESYKRLAPTLTGTPKAASQAAYRARRKLAAAVAQAA